MVEGATPLARDLPIRVVRNRTELPFLLGDAPCVFSNHYQRDVVEHGVTGLAAQGLMIAMPLDPSTYLLAADPGTYKFHQSGSVIDLEDRSDVVQMNRLQALAAEQCLYFAHGGHAAHAREMLDSSPVSDSEARGGFQVMERVQQGDATSDGAAMFRPVEGNQVAAHGDLLMIFERQLPLTLDLSVIDTREFEGIAAAYGPRCRSMVEEFDEAHRSEPSGPLRIEELVRDVEAQLETW